MTTPCVTSRDQLLELLQPVLRRIAPLVEEPAEQWADRLRSAFPVEGEVVQQIGTALAQGIEQGWLCDRGDATARFSRVAKASPETSDLSIDVVALEGPALEHTHPRGELTLGFAAPGSDPAHVRFEEQPPGWVVCQPGSRHVPTVTGGRMHLLYFLPGGAVQWHG